MPRDPGLDEVRRRGWRWRLATFPLVLLAYFGLNAVLSGWVFVVLWIALAFAWLTACAYLGARGVP